jgi:hypothetical protein
MEHAILTHLEVVREIVVLGSGSAQETFLGSLGLVRRRGLRVRRRLLLRVAARDGLVSGVGSHRREGARRYLGEVDDGTDGNGLVEAGGAMMATDGRLMRLQRAEHSHLRHLALIGPMFIVRAKLAGSKIGKTAKTISILFFFLFFVCLVIFICAMDFR